MSVAAPFIKFAMIVHLVIIKLKSLVIDCNQNSGSSDFA